MALDLPIYLMVGEQPVSAVEVDGQLQLRGWDFEAGEMTRDAVSWDDIVGLQPDVTVRANAKLSDSSDTRRVTKREFQQAVRRLQKAEAG